MYAHEINCGVRDTITEKKKIDRDRLYTNLCVCGRRLITAHTRMQFGEYRAMHIRLGGERRFSLSFFKLLDTYLVVRGIELKN